MAAIPRLPDTSIPPYVNIYEMTDSQITTVMSSMNNMSVEESLQNFLLNTTPYDGIDSIIQIPNGFSNISDTTSNTFEIHSGMWTMHTDGTTNIAKKHTKRYFESETYELNIPVPYPGAHSNYMDYPPYTKMKIHIPYVGYMDIDPSYIYNSILRVKYVIDYCTGKGMCFINSQTFSGTQIGIIETECNFANTIPFNVAKGNAFSGAIKNLFGNFAQFGLNQIGSLIQTSEQTSRGSVTDSGLMSDLRMWIEVTSVKDPTDDSSRSSVIGLPTNAVSALTSYTGYIKVSDIHTDGISATDEEKREIETLLKSGVYVKGWS